MHKYLSSAVMEVMLTDLTEKEASLYEYISVFVAWQNYPELSLNSQAGGVIAPYKSEETKHKLRIANLGKKHKPESCAKMSASRAGKSCPWASVEKPEGFMVSMSFRRRLRDGQRVVVSKGEAGFACTFLCLNYAANFIGTSACYIKKTKRIHGYDVELVGGSNYHRPHNIKTLADNSKAMKKPIAVYDRDLNLYNICESVTCAAITIGVKPCMITNAIREGAMLRAGRYLVKYVK